MDTQTILVRRIQALCAQKSMTLEELAARVGVPPAAVWEEDWRDVPLAHVKTLCDGLGISLREFFAAPLFM